eukprot:724775-Amphidinium_carterae.1
MGWDSGQEVEWWQAVDWEQSQKEFSSPPWASCRRVVLSACKTARGTGVGMVGHLSPPWKLLGPCIQIWEGDSALPICQRLKGGGPRPEGEFSGGADKKTMANVPIVLLNTLAALLPDEKMNKN